MTDRVKQHTQKAFSAPIRLPWTNETAPHLVLEVSEGCNIVCRGCYKRRIGGFKSLANIERDLDMALAQRRVQTVSLAGAEPTLHPQLVEIVTRVQRRGLKSALITNGLRLDDSLLTRLSEAGLDVVMLHVDEGQQRADLSSKPSEDEVNVLRLTLVRRVAAHRLDAGLCTTIFPDSLARLPSLVRLVLDSEQIGFVFATHFVDVLAIATGRLTGPFSATGNAEVAHMLRVQFGLEPFAEADPARPLHWMSYCVPVAYENGHAQVLPLRAGALDALLVSLPRWLSGRNLYYYRQKPLLTLAHVLLNRFACGDATGLARILAVRARGARLHVKRMVFDNGLRLSADGRWQCLEYCPNATVRDGRLVPVCLSDYASSARLSI